MQSVWKLCIQMGQTSRDIFNVLDSVNSARNRECDAKRCRNIMEIWR